MKKLHTYIVFLTGLSTKVRNVLGQQIGIKQSQVNDEQIRRESELQDLQKEQSTTLREFAEGTDIIKENKLKTFQEGIDGYAQEKERIEQKEKELGFSYIEKPVGGGGTHLKVTKDNSALIVLTVYVIGGLIALFVFMCIHINDFTRHRSDYRKEQLKYFTTALYDTYKCDLCILDIKNVNFKKKNGLQVRLSGERDYNYFLSFASHDGYPIRAMSKKYKLPTGEVGYMIEDLERDSVVTLFVPYSYLNLNEGLNRFRACVSENKYISDRRSRRMDIPMLVYKQGKDYEAAILPYHNESGYGFSYKSKIVYPYSNNTTLYTVEQPAEVYKSDDLNHILEKWDRSHNEKDTTLFKELYTDSVDFYQSYYSKSEVLDKKKKLLYEDSQDFHQQSGNVKIFFTGKGSCVLEFDKNVCGNSSDSMYINYPSYLYLVKIGKEWKITVESDKKTDEELLR